MTNRRDFILSSLLWTFRLYLLNFTQLYMLTQLFYSGKVLQDFQSKVLKGEWEKRQKYMMARGNQRRIEDLKREEALKEHMENFRAQNEKVHRQLDERIDKQQNRFSDTKFAMNYDLKRMGNSYSNREFEESKPCLTQRTSVAVCFKNDPKLCGDFMEALDQCVGKSLAKQ